MENVCYHCGKSVLYGRTHTHHRGVAGGRWKKRAPKKQKIFKANLIRLSIVENGKTRRVKLCASCLKRIKKDMKDGVKPFVQLAIPRKRVAKEKTATS
jgi:ribosomal protein L28